MKIRLFHAPYVDQDGTSRTRLCAFVFGVDPETDQTPGIAETIRGALEKAESESVVMAITSDFDDVDLGWL